MPPGTTRIIVIALLASVCLLAGLPAACAVDVYFDGSPSNDYNVDANWSSNFRPEAQFNERAIIGTDNPAATLAPAVTLNATPVKPGGLSFAVRQRDATSGAFLNPAPAAGALTGALTISSGTLDVIAGTNAAIDGRVLVGVEGRGYLTMTGGTLNATALTVAGEQNASGNGTSQVDLSGNAAVNITGTTGLFGLSTFGRRLRVTGPNVNFNTSRNLRFESTNAYTAVITSATAHSPLKTGGNAIVNGALNVQFSGAGATHAVGQTWTLIDSSLNANAIAGNFNNLLPGGDVPVSGLASPPPAGAVYRLKKTSSGTHSLLQLVYDRVLVLRVNRDTGELSMRNPLGAAVKIDSYNVTSPLGSLVASYNGISGTAPTPPDPGWNKPLDAASQPLNTRFALTEVKTPDTTPPIINTDAFDLTSVASVPLGVGFSRTAVGSNVANFGIDGEDVVFEYSGPNGGVVRGQVEYVGTKFENNLVLSVNNSGQAVIKNDSLQTLTFDGYSILSSTNSLDTTWTGLAGPWEKSQPPTSGSLSQTNPTSATTLAPGASVALGHIGTFSTAQAQAGLSMQFILSVGFGSPAGDLDADGDVDGSDFIAFQRGLGTTTTAADLANIRANYGSSSGGPPETNFRLASVVFTGAAGAGAAAAVPEPAAYQLLLAAVGLGAAISQRGVRRRVTNQVENSAAHPRVAQRREVAMAKRISIIAAMAAGLVASIGAAQHVAAATQGIPLINNRFEQPGPVGTKVVAFDNTGAPIPGIIPGWTFDGPGMATFGDNVPGDSGTEGGGNPGNELLLSTLDGVVSQTTTFNVVSVPATQKVLLSFDAHDIFTINATGGQFSSSQNQFTARLYYESGGVRTTIGDPLVVSATPGGWTHYTLEFAGGSPALAPAIGKPIGVEFDTTSVEFNPLVANSWTGYDNVLLQVAGVNSGDLDGDGDIDLTDYRVIRDNLQEAHDYLFEGDITGDGLVDLRDFRAWKSLPHVAASGVLAQIAVPEPSVFALGLIAMGALSFVASRQRRFAALRLHRASVLIIAVAFALGTARQASAELLFYDPFNIGASPAAGQYTAGLLDATAAVDDGQNPTVGPTPFFTGPWQIRTSDGNAPNQNIVTTGLSFLGSPASGGAVQTVPTAADSSGRVGRYLSTPWDTTTSGTFYISFLAAFGTAAAPDATGDTGRADLGFRTVEFWPAGGQVGVDDNRSEVGYQGFAGDDAERLPSSAHLHFSTPGIGPQVLTDTTFNQDNNATHLIVMKFVLVDSAVDPAGDTISVFLDPTSIEEPVLANATTTGRNFTLSAMSTISRFGTPGGIMPTFDELRVGTTFVDVVPDFPLPGDTNGDDKVDMTDYLAIIRHMNLTGQTTANGDVTGDGKVSIADYRLWKDHRSDLSAGVPANIGIPEPTCLLLALTAGAMIRRRRR